MENKTNEDILLEKLERINKEKQEVINSPAYKLGYRLLEMISLLKKCDVKKVISNIRNKVATKKLLSKMTVEEDKETRYERVDKKSRIVVYTCIVGNYDSLALPLVNFENVDYFLLTDNPNNYSQYSRHYKIVQLPKNLLNEGNILANRYVKFHPKEFFEGYDFSIYLDGNVRVISDIRKFVCKSDTITGVAMHRHRERDCIYDEAEACRLYRRGNLEKLKQQTELYMKKGFPHHFGMNEATIIVSDLNNDCSSKLLDLWWAEFVRSESFRDQIAWPYVLWSQGYSIDDVGNLGYNIYKNYVVEMLKHQ